MDCSLPSSSEQAWILQAKILDLKKKYWTRFPHAPSGDLPDPGIEPVSLGSPEMASRFFTTSTIWEAQKLNYSVPKPRPHLTPTILPANLLILGQNTEIYLLEKLTKLRAKVLTWEMQELYPTILLDPELLFPMRIANSPILPPNQLFKHFILKRDSATSLLGGERD